MRHCKYCCSNVKCTRVSKYMIIYIPQRAGTSPRRILSTNTSLTKFSFLSEQRDAFDEVDKHVNNIRMLTFLIYDFHNYTCIMINVSSLKIS